MLFLLKKSNLLLHAIKLMRRYLSKKLDNKTINTKGHFLCYLFLLKTAWGSTLK